MTKALDGFCSLHHGSLALLAMTLSGAALPSCTLENKVSDPDPDVPDNVFLDAPSARSLELWDNPGDNLLAAVAEVEMNDENSVLPAYNRVLGSMLNEVGAYFSAATSYAPFGDTFTLENEECENSELPDAIEELCVAIQGRGPDPDDPEDDGSISIVMINDLPHGAFHRSVMRKLLGCAKEIGFTHLAIEALEEDDATLVARGYVSRSQSGHFTREPQLARLIEDGIAQGYRLVSYDVADRCTDCGPLEAINRQAEQQAQNLMAKTFALDPAAKVLVFSGARQSYKEIWGPDEPYTKSLGSHLWEMSGHEPYSVEQIAVNLPSLPFGASSPSPPSGMYLASGPFNGSCMGSYTPDTPTARGTLDGVVVHVPPRGDEQRWDWIHAPEDERRTVTPSCSTCTDGQRLLVQVFPDGVDIADRVPVDQAVCAGGASCQMILPAAPYQFVVWSEQERIGEARVDLAVSTSANVAL